MSNLGNEMKVRYHAPHSGYVVTTTSEFEPLKWKLDFFLFFFFQFSYVSVQY